MLEGPAERAPSRFTSLGASVQVYEPIHQALKNLHTDVQTLPPPHARTGVEYAFIPAQACVHEGKCAAPWVTYKF